MQEHLLRTAETIFVIMENEQCDCYNSKMFPHRRKKCALGLGKSKGSVPTAPVEQPGPPEVRAAAEPSQLPQYSTNSVPYARAVVVMDGDFGGGGGGGDDGLHFVQPIHIPPAPQSHTQSAPQSKPSLGTRISDAFQDGLVSGTYLGTTSGTAHVVRGAIINTSSAIIGAACDSMSSKRK